MTYSNDVQKIKENQNTNNQVNNLKIQFDKN